MKPPQVSVLMAVHDGAAALGQTLDSLRNQVFQDFELVVVDDGSRDDSAARLEQAGDPRIRLIRQENTGLTRALNRGLESCQAPFVARIDCGDRCHPERLKRQLEYLEKHPEVLALGCRVRRLDREGIPLGLSEVVCDPARIQRGLLRINLFQHSSLMFRRDALVRAGGYRPFFRYAQDLDLLLRLSEQGPLANLPDVLSDWVLDPGSISFRRRAEQAGYARIARECALGRRAGRPDPVEQGLVSPPDAAVPEPGALQAAYHLELARSCLMGGSRTRARRELGLAMEHGLPLVAIVGLWGLSWLPGPLLDGLRALRVRHLTGGAL